MFLLRRPTPREIEEFLASARRLPLSYSPVGLVREPRPGFTVDELVTVLGTGHATYQRAAAALTAWKQFELGWVELFPRGTGMDGNTTVAVCVSHVGFWSLNGCRIVYTIGGPDELEFGFAYGTLTNHAESGEEIFQVSLDPRTEQVTYTIRAVARARAPLARLGYPITRVLQGRFRRDSSRAMLRAVT